MNLTHKRIIIGLIGLMFSGIVYSQVGNVHPLRLDSSLNFRWSVSGGVTSLHNGVSSFLKPRQFFTGPTLAIYSGIERQIVSKRAVTYSIGSNIGFRYFEGRRDYIVPQGTLNEFIYTEREKYFVTELNVFLTIDFNGRNRMYFLDVGPGLSMTTNVSRLNESKTNLNDSRFLNPQFQVGSGTSGLHSGNVIRLGLYYASHLTPLGILVNDFRHHRLEIRLNYLFR